MKPDTDKFEQSRLNSETTSMALPLVSCTISEDYRNQNRLLHQMNPNYGVSVLQYLDAIKEIYVKSESASLLDYGCGKGMLAKSLDLPIQEYDPAIEGKDNPPNPADFVVCVDVLEHVEPDLLFATLTDITRCIKKVGYIVISTVSAVKTLPDGRNTHLIQKNKYWWIEQLSAFFCIHHNQIIEKSGKVHFVVIPKRLPGPVRQTFHDAPLEAGV
jgi:hypothetical protein